MLTATVNISFICLAVTSPEWTILVTVGKYALMSYVCFLGSVMSSMVHSHLLIFLFMSFSHARQIQLSTVIAFSMARSFVESSGSQVDRCV